MHTTRTLAQALYSDSELGALQRMPKAGSALENVYVYDASARELRCMAEHGLVEIVEEKIAPRGDERLIVEISFRRLR